LVVGTQLFTTSIGDTRIYLIRKHMIKQITVDHTWIQEALEKGTITHDQVVGHPNAHVIRRYLGAPVVPEADQRLQLRRGEDDKHALANQGIRPHWPTTSSRSYPGSCRARRMNGPGARGYTPPPRQGLLLWRPTCHSRSISAIWGGTYRLHILKG